MAARFDRMYVLTEREAGTALACAQYVLERVRSPLARALADDLTRSMSADGHVPPAVADMGTGSAGGINGSTLSVAEAAQLLDLSHRQTSRYLPPEGPLRGVMVGKTWVLDRTSVEELLQERRRTA